MADIRWADTTDEEDNLEDDHPEVAAGFNDGSIPAFTTQEVTSFTAQQVRSQCFYSSEGIQLYD
jgi:hypothetical protein